MTSRYGRKCVKNEELNLQCEWNDCRQVYNDLSDFYTHLYDHFQSNYSLEGLQSSSTGIEDFVSCVFVQIQLYF